MSFCERLCCIEKKTKTTEYMLNRYSFTELDYNTLKNAGITDEYIEIISERKELIGAPLYDYLLKKREDFIHKTISKKNNQKNFNRTFTQM